MDNLIKIEVQRIGNELQDTVSARELHEWLGVATPYTMWFQRRSEEAQLVDGKDFMSLSQTCEKLGEGRPSKDHAVTINAAEHIAMLERTDKGKAVRQYFIDHERQSKATLKRLASDGNRAISIYDAMIGIGERLRCPVHYVQAEAIKEVKRLTGFDATQLLLKAPDQDAIADADVMLEVTELGKRLGLSAANTNKFIESLGWQVKTHYGWEPTTAGVAHMARHSWQRGGKTGYNIKWRVATIAEQYRRTTAAGRDVMIEHDPN